MANQEFSVRIGQDELGHLLQLKGNLEQQARWCEHLSHYQALGLDLAAVNLRGEDLGLDLKQPQEQWWERLLEWGRQGLQVNLGVRTGGRSGLLVLELEPEVESINQRGDWRAAWVARLKDGRQQHYYVLPPEIKAPPSCRPEPEVLIYGEPGLVWAPPSQDPESGEAWEWLSPPWESPPQPPPPAVWAYLRERLAPGALRARQAPPWEELYRLIAPYDAVLQALLAPPVTLEKYYQEIVRTALSAGLKDRQDLLGLLWHAPHGDARRNSAGWAALQEMVDQALPAGENLSPPAVWAVEAPWPDWGPPAEKSAAIPLAASDVPWDENKLRQILGDLQVEPRLTRFARSVSGQFLQLLAVLGEKVMAENFRQEAGRCATAQPAAKAAAAAGTEQAAAPLLEDFPWSAALAPKNLKSTELREVKARVREFLRSNPDLKGDRRKVQMVLFSLKNYVSPNPEYAGLSFQDKLELAGRMARNFLDQPAEPL